MALTHVTTQDDYDKEVKGADKTVVIDFWAEWCGPCKMLGPIFEALSDEYEDVKFVKIDVDEAEEVASQFNIMSIPTLAIVKDGEVVEQQAGALTKDQLKDFIDQHK